MTFPFSLSRVQSHCVCVATGLLIDVSGAQSREDPKNAVIETEFTSSPSHDGQSPRLCHEARM